jgi:hypothetical protein
VLAVSPVLLALVVVTFVTDDGAVALLVTAYSYDTLPEAAGQLNCTPVVPMLVILIADGAEHPGVTLVVVKV